MIFRSSVGFDSIPLLPDSATRVSDHADSYPPYSIENTDENNYWISIAVAGFGEADLEVAARENMLVVSSRAQNVEDRSKYLYRGIAGRAFERKFQLADHIFVISADQTNGLLHINLELQVPKKFKPRTIEIQTGDRKQLFGAAA